MERAGHDVRALLRQVPAFVDQAHTPAAYPFRVADDYATEQGAAATQADGTVQGDGDRPTVTLDGEWRETVAAGGEDARGDRPEAGQASAGTGDRGIHAAKLAAQAGVPPVDRDRCHRRLVSGPANRGVTGTAAVSFSGRDR
ncbi:hypothetical protein [Micromonospora sp. CA-248212]|uniref:hypothetical protein n=1 Tax=Micromonospora sp. CA-248212 TaxID=3239961 RepID=UPI003D90514D